MKKSILLTLVFAFFGVAGYSQLTTTKKMEQMMDKNCVQTVTVLNRTFNVGDTICFSNGSSPYGDFLCSSMSILQNGTMFISAMTGTFNPGTKKYLGVECTNSKMVITKIRDGQYGPDHIVQLVNIVTYGKTSMITTIDPYVGLTRKEIGLK